MATKSVVVTRGASFIGAHLIENLLRTRHHVCIVDDSGSKAFLENVIDRVEIARVDMAKNPSELIQIFRGYDTVFHLADTYGGCNAGHYQPALLCENMVIDNIVVDSAAAAGVNHVQFCSSNCTHTWKNCWEAQHGLSRLSGDSLLKARCEEFGMKGSIVKLASTYGPGQSETHPVMALIAKAFVRQEPYEMPGGWMQHNFTYVQDVAECIRLAAERISDCSQVHLGTQELVTINGLMEIVFESVGWRPGKVFSNPAKQVIDGGRATASNLELLGFDQWKSLRQGVKETADWYMGSHTRAYVEDNLQMLLQGVAPQQPEKREYRKATKLRRLAA